MNKLQWSAIIASIILVSGTVIYFVAKKAKVAYWKYLLIMFLIFAVVGGITWFVAWLIRRNNPEEEIREFELKRPVDQVPAIKAWAVQFAKWSKIPLIEKHWSVDKEISLLEDDSIKVIRSKLYVPKGADERVISFIALVRRGSTPGLHLFTLMMDKGIEFIEKNWQANMDLNFVQFDPQTEKYPVSSFGAEQKSLISHLLEEYSEEGKLDDTKVRLLEKSLSKQETTSSNTKTPETKKISTKKPKQKPDQAEVADIDAARNEYLGGNDNE